MNGKTQTHSRKTALRFIRDRGSVGLTGTVRVLATPLLHSAIHAPGCGLVKRMALTMEVPLLHSAMQVRGPWYALRLFERHGCPQHVPYSVGVQGLRLPAIGVGANAAHGFTDRD